MLQGGPSGRFGRRGPPYLARFHVLPLCAPAVDVLAGYGMFVLDRCGWPGRGSPELGYCAVLIAR